MKTYLAIVHHEEDSAYGVWFPDLPGCFGAGETEDEAIENAKKSLLLYAEKAEDNCKMLCEPRSIRQLRNDPEVLASLEEGGFIVQVPLVLNSGRKKRVSLDLDVALIEWIDSIRIEANLTRKAWFEQLARDRIFEHFAGLKKPKNCVRLTRKGASERKVAA